jgi:signal transduction histidine kinase
MAPADPFDLRHIIHELRQPLGAMANRAYLLEDEPLSAEGRKHVAALSADVKRLAATLDELAAVLERAETSHRLLPEG